MGVDGNFQKLEDEVNRLLEILEELRQENARLQNRVDALESQNGDLEALNKRLAEMAEEARAEAGRRAEVRARLERILGRLDEIPSQGQGGHG